MSSYNPLTTEGDEPSAQLISICPTDYPTDDSTKMLDLLNCVSTWQKECPEYPTKRATVEDVQTFLTTPSNIGFLGAFRAVIRSYVQSDADKLFEFRPGTVSQLLKLNRAPRDEYAECHALGQPDVTTFLRTLSGFEVFLNSHLAVPDLWTIDTVCDALGQKKDGNRRHRAADKLDECLKVLDPRYGVKIYSRPSVFHSDMSSSPREAKRELWNRKLTEAQKRADTGSIYAYDPHDRPLQPEIFASMIDASATSREPPQGSSVNPFVLD